MTMVLAISQIAWEADYAKGLTRAKAEGLPILLYFTADW